MGEAAAAVSLESGEEKREIWIKHYSSSHRILLVGEGDFSFSACLARAFGSANNMIATSYDDLDKLLEKHPIAKIHLEVLKRLGCTILHGINVKYIWEDSFLKVKRFDRIIFNFPHAGHYLGFPESDEEIILMHKKLVCNFFSRARSLLSENGEIHVTHRDDPPYNNWDIRASAKARRLILKEMVKFRKEDYPGYENKRGGDIRSDETFSLGLYDVALYQYKLLEKYCAASTHLDELERLGCTILHGINVKDMHEDDFLKTKRFDRIIFNFPHSGHEIGLRERDEELILRHRKLLSDFFSSAMWLLSKNAEIHVSHRDDDPYTQWRIRSLAKMSALILKEMVVFRKEDYPGYENKRGGDIKSNETFPLGNRSFTFKFSLDGGFGSDHLRMYFDYMF